VLIGAELLGVLGALIAIPVAGSLQLLFRELTSGSIHGRPKPAPDPPPA
jgi:predicted PurR-regulated permease PerM